MARLSCSAHLVGQPRAMRNLLRAAAIAAALGASTVALTGCTLQQYPAALSSHCTVTGKDRVASGSSGDSEMRVYTANCGTFEVGDDPFHGIYNSSDTYGSIQPGHVYDFHAYGYRNGFTSTFPLIESATEVAK